MQAGGLNHSLSATTLELHNNSTGREPCHEGDNLVSVMSGAHTTSQNKENNKGDVNGAKRKRAAKLDLHIRPVTRCDVSGHKNGTLESTTIVHHTASGNRTNKKQIMNGSKMKRSATVDLNNGLVNRCEQPFEETGTSVSVTNVHREISDNTRNSKRNANGPKMKRSATVDFNNGPVDRCEQPSHEAGPSVSLTSVPPMTSETRTDSKRNANAPKMKRSATVDLNNGPIDRCKEPKMKRSSTTVGLSNGLINRCEQLSWETGTSESVTSVHCATSENRSDNKRNVNRSTVKRSSRTVYLNSGPNDRCEQPYQETVTLESVTSVHGETAKNTRNSKRHVNRPKKKRSATVDLLNNGPVDRCEQTSHEAGPSVLLTSVHRSSSENKTNSKRNANGSKMKRSATVDLNNGPIDRCEQLCQETGTSESVRSVHRKTSKNRTHNKQIAIMSKMKRAAAMDLHSVPVNRCEEPSDGIGALISVTTDHSAASENRTKNKQNASGSKLKRASNTADGVSNFPSIDDSHCQAANKISSADENCTRTETERDGTSLRSILASTSRQSRKMTDSSAAHTEASSSMKCSKVKFNAAGTVQKTYRHKDPSPGSKSNATLSSRQRTRSLPAGDTVCRQTEDCREVKTDVAPTLQKTVKKYDIAVPCSSFSMTLRSSRRSKGLTSGNTGCKQASDAVDSSQEKNNSVGTVAETNKQRKYAHPCSTLRRRGTAHHAISDAVCAQADCELDCNSKTLETEHEGQPLYSNIDVTVPLPGTDHPVANDQLSAKDNIAVDRCNINNNVAAAAKKTLKKRSDAASSIFSMTLRSRRSVHCCPPGAQVSQRESGTVDDSAAKSARKAPEETEDLPQRTDSDTAVPSCSTADLHTEGDDDGVNKSRKDPDPTPSFRMTLRSLPRERYDVMAGVRRPRRASAPVSTKRSVKSADDSTLHKPGWSGDESLHRYSKQMTLLLFLLLV